MPDEQPIRNDRDSAASGTIEGPRQPSACWGTAPFVGLILAYLVAAIWFSGWLTGTAGFDVGVIVGMLSLIPAFHAFALSASVPAPRRWQYVSLAVWTTIAIVIALIFIHKFPGSEMHKDAVFRTECRVLRRHLASQPEYEDVDVSYYILKRRAVTLSGFVRTKAAHDRLIEKVGYMVRYADGWDDKVDYPGRAEDKEAKSNSKKE